MSKRLLFISSAAWSAIALTTTAQAQNAPETTTAEQGANLPSAQGAEPNSGIQDIVITAQRRTENLQRAALPVSAIGGDALTSAGITKPTELTSVVPALQIAPAGGPYSLFYLRGVGNFSANALSDSAVAFNFDGVFIGRPAGTTGFFYDVARVEVVKGPQGTLYGRNATGGAINIISRKAELGELSGYVNGEYGNYEARRVDAAINVPVSETVAVRAAGIYVARDGYMKDGTDDQNDLGGRLSVHAEPASNLRINAAIDYFQQRGIGGGATPATGTDDRFGLLSAEGKAFYASQPNTVLGNYMSPLTQMPYQRNHSWGASATVDWTLPFGSVTFIPAHRELSLDFRTVTAGMVIQEESNTKQNSVELRFASNEDNALRYLLGAYYFDEKTQVPRYSVNQQANINFQRYDAQTQSEAIFGRLTYALMPELRFNASGRYTWEDKEFSGVLDSATRACVVPSTYFPTYVPGCPTASAFPGNTMTPPTPVFIPGPDGTVTIPGIVDQTGPNARKRSFSKFTYRLSADFDVTPRNLLYASYETSFKSGGFFFQGGGAGGTFEPESISAYTVGSKNRFAGNRLQLNLEAFYWRYKDQQVSHTSLDTLGNVIFATENVGRATFKGFEIEAQYRPLRNTTLSADVQYLDAQYDSFVYNLPNQNGGVSNGTACPNIGVPTTVYTVNCSGRRPPNAPEWTLNFGAEQIVPVGDAEIVLNARARYQSSTLLGLEFTSVEFQSGYWIADAQVTYKAADERFTIGAFVNNLTNETVGSFSTPVPFSTFNVQTLRPPRTYGVRAGFKF